MSGVWLPTRVRVPILSLTMPARPARCTYRAFRTALYYVSGIPNVSPSDSLPLTLSLPFSLSLFLSLSLSLCCACVLYSAPQRPIDLTATESSGDGELQTAGGANLVSDDRIAPTVQDTSSMVEDIFSEFHAGVYSRAHFLKYTWFSRKANRDGAERACSSMGGALPIVHDIYQYHALVDKAAEAGVTNYQIGLRRQINENGRRKRALEEDWEWSFGADYNTNLPPGQQMWPSDRDGKTPHPTPHTHAHTHTHTHLPCLSVSPVCLISDRGQKDHNCKKSHLVFFFLPYWAHTTSINVGWPRSTFCVTWCVCARGRAFRAHGWISTVDVSSLFFSNIFSRTRNTHSR